ncbi:hypothetical protein AC244_15500 [Ensifer adhaerens]|uniref:DNA adenine methylase n=1 Tax=Ensifer adhaerens TaxID=106592 RepID=A0A0L8BTF0_ENSAD|nr:DNA adenine methylase [Ensifer adhaerens]KOF17794.1 hypothetical protein AC244_15500 [Ensifer adhaerens]
MSKNWSTALSAVHSTLKFQITNRRELERAKACDPDGPAFLDRYDRPGTLFYLDPPYFGSEDDHGKALFGRDQFAALAERLRRLRGRFILSINDVPEIRKTFAGFALHEAELTYSVSAGRGTPAHELIIVG